MDEIKVTTEHMKGLEALARVNLAVSDAKNSLVKLQEMETEYLVSREKKAMDRIQAAFDSSKELVEQTNKNYELIEDFAESVEEGAQFLARAVETFGALTEAFEKKQELRDRDIKNQQETINGIKKILSIETLVIKRNKEAIDARNLELNQKESKMNDERGTIDRAITRLKEGRV